MKTLILNGSPRPDGDVSALIAALRGSLSGEVMELAPEGISGCTDCRYCWRQAMKRAARRARRKPPASS